MSPARIRTRRTAKGEPRYTVVYRRGGRTYPVESAGTFRTMRDARTRRDLVAGWLAAGLNPRTELDKRRREETRRTFADAAAAFIASRVDVDESTRTGYQRRARRLAEIVGDRDPLTLTVDDARALVTALSETLKPSSVKAYVGTARQILDFAGAEPNPLRDPAVKLPRDDREEVQPPSGREVARILDVMAPRHRLPLAVLEQTAMRVGELASLTWGDVDVAESRFRLSRARTKTNRPRWVQVPRWLMGYVEELLPLEDRTAGRLVFPGATDAALRQAMKRACRTAGLPVYSPHDLRHRRATLWHHQGVPVRELQERGGWARASILLDVYSHVMPGDEVPAETWERVLR